MSFKQICTALSFGLVSGLAACSPTMQSSTGGTYGPVPEEVRALAASYQDVNTARILPEDGCYWYEHSGPVETTLLPLLTAEGRPICTSASAPATTG